ncbi:ABC transporter permease [Clostridium aceticum]|nr:ABC transporter permease [Clostridium aceticum]KJF27391.1 ABC transporter permease [Clostridium aceticum]
MKKIKGWFIPIMIILIWTIGSALELWNAYIIPSPMRTLQSTIRLLENGTLFKHIVASLNRVLIGFIVAFFLAFPLGIMLGMKTKLIHYFNPILEFVRHVPPLATVPMLILWFGIGEMSKIVIIILASFFPIFLNTLNGVLHCDKKLLEVGESFGLSSYEKFYKIILPATLPYIFVGMRLGLGYSWRALIGAELVAASSGIGYMILDAQQLSRTDVVIVGILTIGILGSAIDYLFFKLTQYFTILKEGDQQHGWS